MNKELLVILACTAMLLGCNAQRNNSRGSAVNAHVYNVEEYLRNSSELEDGQIVFIEGFLVVAFEDCSIWRSREDLELGPASKGVWISFSDTNCLGPEVYDMEYQGHAIVSGKHEADRKGRFGLYGGQISAARILEHVEHRY